MEYWSKVFRGAGWVTITLLFSYRAVEWLTNRDVDPDMVIAGGIAVLLMLVMDIHREVHS
jgi:hypothetical protein